MHSSGTTNQTKSSTSKKTLNTQHEVSSLAILELLPQTQCQRCGYLDCQAYAEAIANKQALYNQCQPGGQEGVLRLAQCLQAELPVLELNPEFGFEAERSTVHIDEEWCIGCTLCLDACPVDAIVGSNKQMHSVASEHCTGCELCIPVCPVDCIELAISTPGRTGWAAWSAEQAQSAAKRYAAHKARLAKQETEYAQRLAQISSSLIRSADKSLKITQQEQPAQKSN